jgi:hypothetical protein
VIQDCFADPVRRSFKDPQRNVSSWYEVYERDCMHQYRTTETHWDPFVDGVLGVYTIGIENCTDQMEHCNGPLRANTNYSLMVRAFTKSGYSDTAPIFFKTLEEMDSAPFIDENIFFGGMGISALLIVGILGTSAVIIKKR